MVEASKKFSRLPDPLNDRHCKEVPCPPNKPLENKVLFPYSGIPLYYQLIKT